MRDAYDGTLAMHGPFPTAREAFIDAIETERVEDPDDWGLHQTRKAQETHDTKEPPETFDGVLVVDKYWEAATVALQMLESIRATNAELIADHAPDGWGLNRLRQTLANTPELLERSNTAHLTKALAQLQSVIDWTGDSSDMPSDSSARLQWYARRLSLIRSAAQFGLEAPKTAERTVSETAAEEFDSQAPGMM